LCQKRLRLSRKWTSVSPCRDHSRHDKGGGARSGRNIEHELEAVRHPREHPPHDNQHHKNGEPHDEGDKCPREPSCMSEEGDTYRREPSCKSTRVHRLLCGVRARLLLEPLAWAWQILLSAS